MQPKRTLQRLDTIRLHHSMTLTSLRELLFGATLVIKTTQQKEAKVAKYPYFIRKGFTDNFINKINHL